MTTQTNLLEREITILTKSRNPKGFQILNNRGWKAYVADDLLDRDLVTRTWDKGSESYRIFITETGMDALEAAMKRDFSEKQNALCGVLMGVSSLPHTDEEGKNNNKSPAMLAVLASNFIELEMARNTLVERLEGKIRELRALDI